MEKMTITEALSEINLIKKKITAKQKKVGENLYRPDHLKDLFESEGGSEKMIESELQSIRDLGQRLMKIRSCIADANLTNTITLDEQTRSIHDWLIWKREISKEFLSFIKQCNHTTKTTMDQQAKQPQVWKNEKGEPQLVKMITHTDYSKWTQWEQNYTDMIESLDGKLSLKNATIVITL